MDDSIVYARDVHYSYRNGGVVTPAVCGIDLAVKCGEFVVIEGPSGCGKSTLLHVLGMMTRPDRAESLIVDGQQTIGLGEAGRTRLRREKIGFVFQRFNLLPVVSALDNVKMALRFRGGAGDGQAERALAWVGLSDVAGKKPGHLSIGQQQRVAVARAVACRPPLLLADEPTGSLDSASAQRVLQLLKDLQRRDGQTIIMITHNEHIVDFADRVIRMKDGRFEPQ